MSSYAIIADKMLQIGDQFEHYQIQAHMPLPELASTGSAVGDVLALLMAGGEAEGSDGPVGRACSPHRQGPMTESGGSAA